MPHASSSATSSEASPPPFCNRDGGAGGGGFSVGQSGLCRRFPAYGGRTVAARRSRTEAATSGAGRNFRPSCRGQARHHRAPGSARRPDAEADRRACPITCFRADGPLRGAGAACRNLAHLALGDAAVGPDGPDQVVDLAGAHPMQVGLHHHREQPLVDPAAALQQRGKNDPARSWGSQLQVARWWW